MSVEIWENPNDPKPEKTQYPIGTEGWVFNDSGRPNNILDDARDSILAAIRTLFPGIGYIPSILVGWIAGDGAYCPTYGLWAGPGWAADDRPINDSETNWQRLPRYDKRIEGSSDNSNPKPDDCYGLEK